MRISISSIRQQIILGFLSVIILLLLFSGVSFYQIDQVRGYAEDIDPLSAQIARAEEFALASSRLEAGVEQYLLTSSSLFEEQVRAELDLMRRDLAEIRAIQTGADDTNLIRLEQRFEVLSEDLDGLFETDFFALSASAQNLFVVELLDDFEQINTVYEAFSTQKLDELTTTSQRQQDILSTLVVMFIILSVLSVVVAFGVSQVITRRVGTPVARAAQAASQMAGGDLSVRLPHTQRQDEVGQLASAFNTMADQLGELVGSLETRVEARTHDLQVAAQVSEQVAAVRDVNRLLPQVVELTKNSFDLYHAHVYLYDEDRQYLELAEGAGEAGRIMKERGHRIPVSARSLVARTARHNSPQIVDDVKQDPNFLANPLLPETRSEAALPLAVGDRVIGVIDVQSERVARFDDDLLSVLGTFSGQLAISLENARLFSEMERTSRHERILGEITQAIQRATSIDEVLQVATRELGRTLRVSQAAIELGLPERRTTAPEPLPDEASAPAATD